MSRLGIGDLWPGPALETVGGLRIDLASPARPVHIQLRRFVGCPICNLHLQIFSQRFDAIRDAGIDTVAVFRSSADELRAYQSDVAMPLIADPDEVLYDLAGVGTSLFAATHPSALAAAAKGTPKTRLNLRPQKAMFGLVGDILVGTDGRILALHRGAHADDQWDVDTLLGLAACTA